MKRDLVIAGVALAAVIGVSLLGHQPESPKAATHASDDYSFGGYRAWYELLRREGVDVARFRLHHDALPDSGIGTLIVAFPDDGVPSSWDAGERSALRAWVRGGGRLVDIGNTPSTGRDEVDNDPVYLAAVKPEHGKLRGPWAAFVGALGDRGTWRLAPTKPQAPKRAKGAKRAPPARRVRVETLLADRAGALVVRYRYGRGEVIGVANAGPFENRALGRGDAARLAFLAARPRGRGLVAFDEAVRGDIVEKAWYRALDTPELVALALIALAGLLWLLYGIVPLGPAVRLRAAREPTSEEFLDAVAALYERARARDRARDALVAEARRALERAPRTAENTALAARIAAAATQPLADDAALVAVAKLARTARENTRTMVMDRAQNNRTPRRTSLRGRTGGSA
ncbi:MAG TPA: DUF4350 domain-containing protein [Candidatus Elarobacter sp.]|nr:DUF4350 domain-containing protein [Candidatus Elarobacter sp.]